MAVITISRQYGSGGDEIAAQVCRELGYRSFDKHLIAEVVAEVGLTEGEILDFTEEHYQAPGFFNRLFGGARSAGGREAKTNAAPVAAGAPADEERSIALVRSAIQAASRLGDFVIVGRGGQVVLKDRPGVLHVRIEAPLDDRVQRVQVQEMTTLAAAYELIARRDGAAADYLKRFYGVEWNDPALYHLVINSARWKTASAAQVIADAARRLPGA